MQMECRWQGGHWLVAGISFLERNASLSGKAEVKGLMDNFDRFWRQKLMCMTGFVSLAWR